MLSGVYYGEILGVLFVCDIDKYNEVYKFFFLEILRVEGLDCYRCKYGFKREFCNVECFENMEKCLIENNEEISVVIVEFMV